MIRKPIPPTRIDDKNRPSLSSIKHPQYNTMSLYWAKYRMTYVGGQPFINYFLKKLSKRETQQDFMERYDLTYNPAFAKALINEVKNSIFQRLSSIRRIGGTSPTYQKCMLGELGGVDLLSNTMNSYIGSEILPELMVLGKVGIYVDMAPIEENASLADTDNKHPYLYTYRAEDILSWQLDNTANPNKFVSVLLRDMEYSVDPFTGLPIGFINKMRHVYFNADNVIQVDFYDPVGEGIQGDAKWNLQKSYTLDDRIRRIPFVTLELTDSLMSDISNYQISLLNIASSDVMYLCRANFPFYVEQYDRRQDLPQLKSEDTENTILTQNLDLSAPTPTNPDNAKGNSTNVGPAAGRRYPKGTEQPAFIHPSSEPIVASMAKQKSMIEEMRQLIGLSLSNVKGRNSSAESKGMDMQGLEAGLSYIGLEIQYGELLVSEYWAAYEAVEPATIYYPDKYSLETDDERKNKINQNNELMNSIPSLTFQKELAKENVKLLLGHKVPLDTLTKIQEEIDKATCMVTDPDTIVQAAMNGLVGNDLGSQCLGFPAGEADKAKIDHADRLARIAQSQMSISGLQDGSGVGDLSTDPNASANQKLGKPKRGEADSLPRNSSEQARES